MAEQSLKDKTMELNKYAPVIITTLNRFEHFKRCLESLEKCTGSDKTDVYVALDYPPSEKYVVGWKKIDHYLHQKEDNNIFKHLLVIRRDHNYGVCHENGNFETMLRDLKGKYDSYILSEDDNEFSPNFIEYMNQGLELYKDDARVIKVSAYTSPLFCGVVDSSTFFGIDTPGFGIGMWEKKERAIDNIDLSCYLKSLPLRRFLGYFFTYPALFDMTIDMIKKKSVWGDVIDSMNNLLFGTFTLQPSLSLTRNWGVDGSGVHCGKDESVKNEIIDTASTFSMKSIPFECPHKIIKRCRYRNMPSNPLRYPFSLVMKLCRAVKFYFA